MTFNISWLIHSGNYNTDTRQLSWCPLCGCWQQPSFSLPQTPMLPLVIKSALWQLSCFREYRMIFHWIVFWLSNPRKKIYAPRSGIEKVPKYSTSHNGQSIYLVHFFIISHTRLNFYWLLCGTTDDSNMEMPLMGLPIHDDLTLGPCDLLLAAIRVCWKHMKTGTKWPSFSRRYFGTHFHERNGLCFSQNGTELGSLEYN